MYEKSTHKVCYPQHSLLPGEKSAALTGLDASLLIGHEQIHQHVAIISLTSLKEAMRGSHSPFSFAKRSTSNSAQRYTAVTHSLDLDLLHTKSSCCCISVQRLYLFPAHQPHHSHTPFPRLCESGKLHQSPGSI